MSSKYADSRNSCLLQQSVPCLEMLSTLSIFDLPNSDFLVRHTDLVIGSRAVKSFKGRKATLCTGICLESSGEDKIIDQV